MFSRRTASGKHAGVSPLRGMPTRALAREGVAPQWHYSAHGQLFPKLGSGRAGSRRPWDSALGLGRSGKRQATLASGWPSVDYGLCAARRWWGLCGRRLRRPRQAAVAVALPCAFAINRAGNMTSPLELLQARLQLARGLPGVAGIRSTPDVGIVAQDPAVSSRPKWLRPGPFRADIPTIQAMSPLPRHEGSKSPCRKT